METVYLSQLLKNIADVKTDCVVSSVVVDSRLAEKSSIFLAIKGDRVNGEAYAKTAVENGACFVLTENPISDISQDIQHTVKNILDTSIQLGANARQLYQLEVIGVTGSVGKTSTKDFIYTALNPFAQTARSIGNHNNEIGMPQTIFNFKKEDRYAVLEMGMAKFGDVHKLSLAAKPKYAVITCIGDSHLEEMKTQENILKAKLEICDGMPADGVLVLNKDDRLLSKVNVENPANIVYFAIENASADVVASDIQQSDFSTRFTILDSKYGTMQCKIPTVGLHNVMNAISAYAIVTRMGFAPHETVKNLFNFEPSGMRQKIVKKDGMTFIEDCCNANPNSVKAVLNTLCEVKATRTIAVLGDMLELGEESDNMHFAVGEYAKLHGVDILLCFGEQAKHIQNGFGKGALHFSTKQSLTEHLKGILKRDDVILFKASRGMAFEEIIEKTYEK